MTRAADERRYLDLQDIGCIPCHIENNGYVPPDMHHLVDLGDREKSGGNSATVPIDPWHHRGVIPKDGMNIDQAEEVFGPSLKHTSRRFHDRYGTDRQLLQITEAILRMLHSERLRGSYPSYRMVGKFVRALHKEIVLGIPPTRMD